jgi:fibronectin type 3 domain-containing protein
MSRGVKLSWTADPAPENGYKVYRREAQVRAYGDAVATLLAPEVTTWTDWTAVLGTRYIYGVAAVGSADPLVESPISEERELLYRDLFPPAVPTHVVAFPEPGQVRILWDLSEEEDLAGFEVRRRIGGVSEAVAVQDELITDSEYVDSAVPPRQLVFYSVIAVDEKGNRSEPSAEVEVRIH